MAGSNALAGRTPSSVVDTGDRTRRALTPAGYAWEFLRRNPTYRRDYDRGGENPSTIDHAWGLRFFANPLQPAPNTDVFWRPEAAPAVVVAAVAVERHSPRDLDLPRPTSDVRRDDDGLHLRLSDDLQVMVKGRASAQGPVVVSLSLDRDFRIRLHAASRLYAAAKGGRAPPASLTSAQRTRLDRALQALDGSLRRENYRTIAEQIFGDDAAGTLGWKTANVRDATIRLVQTGQRLMRGGYLKLLRRP